MLKSTNYDDDLESGYGATSTKIEKDEFYKGLMSGEQGHYAEEEVIHKGFIRKVYGILSFQLLLTFATAAVMSLHKGIREYVISSIGWFYASLVLSIVTLVALICYKNRHPHNMILLTLWTFVEAYTIGVVTAIYTDAGKGDIVLQALFITMAVFIGLTIFTVQSKINFSFLGAALGLCLWILILWGLIIAVFGWKDDYLYSLFGAIVFSLYIVFDTWLLHARLDPDEYILAAISLYLDIINLFLHILSLLSNDRN